MNDPELQYYLYMSDDWRGPYPVAQIRSFLKLGQIDEATYAYEPQHQSQLTVSDLLAGRHVMPQVMGSQAASGFGSSGSHHAVEPAQPATARFSARQSGRLDDAINALEVMRTVCFSIGSTDGRERDDLLDDLKQAYDTIREVLDRLRPSLPELRNFAVQIDKIASDIAARLSDRALTAHLVDMRDCVAHADPDEIIPSAEAVIAQVAHLARTAGEDNPFEIVDDEATPNKGHPIDVYESARFELKSLQTDLSSVKEAYSKLQEAYANEQKQARRLALQLREQLETEQNAHQGDNAELRALAAEIHDLANACGVAESDPGLAQDLGRLAEELQGSNPTTLVPVAESVLNRMVNRLGSDHEELTNQVKELSTVRAELLQLKTDMSILRQREEVLQADKVRIQKQLDEERGAANRVDQSARAREAQLKSTIAALQVTKELHQEVMGDLQEQLQGAQERVEDMERELLSARSELKGTRNTFENREHELVANLEALSRERAELETRQNALSSNLEGAERELASARERAARNEEDESLSEALAAKVNEMRASFEQTRARLREQEGNAGALQKELAAARNEADELRSRSDQLGNELESARGNLDVARRRMEELQRAAARLEAERTSLQSELIERKGTDAIQRTEADGGHLRNVIAQLESQVAQSQAKIAALETELEHERQRDHQLGEAHVDSENRYHDLLAEQERLRGELSILRKGAKDPETTRLLREAKDGLEQAKSKVSLDSQRIAELDERLSETERALRDASEARSDIQAKLASVAGERDRLNGELTRLRTEHEAAAVEHRAAIAAARKAQTESAAKAAELKTQLEAAEAERKRLGEEVTAQRALITDAEDTESRVGALGERLGSESARANQLERELADSRRELAATTVRFERLRDELKEAETERERLSQEINRRHDASAMRDAVDADGRTRLQDALDRLRDQLEREQRRSTDLEHRLESARNDARGAATRHAETAESYADAVARADRVANDLSEERSRNATNLAEAERRLGQERDRGKALESRLGELDGRLSAAAARQQGLERAIADITAERERLTRDLSDARDGKASSEKRSAELAQSLRKAETDLADLHSEMALAQDQRHEITSELASTTGRHSRLAVTVDRLTKELQHTRAQIDAQSTEHEAALHAVKAQVAHDRDVIVTLQQRLGEVESERDLALTRAESLQVRLRGIDTERSSLIAATERLDEDLIESTSALQQRGEPAEVAALQERLAATESELAQARIEIDDTARRGADRLILLEQRLEEEQGHLATVEALREQLRVEATEHAGARTALAEVTAFRDRLQQDLDLLGSELRDLQEISARDLTFKEKLERTEALLAEEHSKVSKLEADLAIARSAQAVSDASRHGLESSLSAVVADRERLLGEVDSLRRELDVMRGRMKIATPSQQAEIAALKQLLDIERQRVHQLEDRLSETWRKQGETIAHADTAIAQRLALTKARVRKLRHRLHDERKKTEDLQSQVEQLQALGTHLSTGKHPAQNPRFDRQPDAGDPLIADKAKSPLQESVDAGDGFVSAFGRPSIRLVKGVPAENESIGFTSRVGRPGIPRSEQPITAAIPRRSQRKIPYGKIATICIAVAVPVAIAFLLLFPYAGKGIVNARAIPIITPISGTITTIGADNHPDLAKGDPIVNIVNDHLDESQAFALERQFKAASANRDAAKSSIALIDREQLRIIENIKKFRLERIEASRSAVSAAEQLADNLSLAVSEADAKVRGLAQAGVEDRAAAFIEVETAKVRLQHAQDKLTQAKKDLQNYLEGKLDHEAPDAKRVDSLAAERTVQQQFFDSAALEAQEFEAALGQEQARLAGLRSAYITAPMDGFLHRFSASVGSEVNAGTRLGSLIHPETVILQIPFTGDPEQFSPGTSVFVHLATDRRICTGTVIAEDAIRSRSSEEDWLQKTPRSTADQILFISIDADPSTLTLGQYADIIAIGHEPSTIRTTLARCYAALRF